MSRILIISNCATEAFRRTFSMLLPESEITALEISDPRLRSLKFTSPEFLNAYQYILVLPHSATAHLTDSDLDARVIIIPNFLFRGYHPDICLVEDRAGKVIRSREFSSYQSAIAFAAWQSGMGVKDALRLFRAGVYEEIGYFSEYDISKELLLKRFRHHSVPIDDLFIEWARGGCFMHTTNHPLMRCFTDIAARVCELHFPGHPAPTYPIPDYLMNNVILPCYPEIAERLGSRGSLHFKISNIDRVVHLRDYVRMSYAFYEKQEGALQVRAEFGKYFERAKHYIEGEFGK